MTTPTSDTFIMNSIAVFSGAGGSTAGTPIGFMPGDANAVVNTVKNATPRPVQGEDLPQEYLSRPKEMTWEIPMLQVDVDLLAIAWGVTKDGLVNTFGDPTVDVRLPKKSYALVGTDAAGTTKRFDMPWGASIGDTAIELGQENGTVLSWTLGATAPTTGSAYPTWTSGSGNLEATLSTGVLTRTAGYHKIRSEVGGAADVLDSISAGAADEDFLTLQIGSVDEPITLTDLANTLELISAPNDFVMTKLTDLVVAQWDLGDTKWVEVQRFDDPN